MLIDLPEKPQQVLVITDDSLKMEYDERIKMINNIAAMTKIFGDLVFGAS